MKNAWRMNAKRRRSGRRERELKPKLNRSDGRRQKRNEKRKPSDGRRPRRNEPPHSLKQSALLGKRRKQKPHARLLWCSNKRRRPTRKRHGSPSKKQTGSDKMQRTKKRNYARNF